jgi:hypothetical protein
VYRAWTELAGFGLLSDASKCRVILQSVRHLIFVDRLLLAELQLPLLYDAPVQYEFQSSVDDWKDIVTCLQTGAGSCNSLAAWRCAELNHYGEPATPRIQTQSVVRPDGSMLDVFHVIVRRGDGVTFEDPSRTLGMPSVMPPEAIAAPSGGR